MKGVQERIKIIKGMGKKDLVRDLVALPHLK